MSLQIEVAPEIESALHSEAARRGMTAQALAGAALGEWLQDAAEDFADAEEARQRLATSDPTQRRSLDDLRRALGK